MDCFLPGLPKTSNGLIVRTCVGTRARVRYFLCLLRDGGGRLIYIEVPPFDRIVNHIARFDIFLGHVNYFGTVDFYAMFDRQVVNGHLINGQYLYVVA